LSDITKLWGWSGILTKKNSFDLKIIQIACGYNNTSILCEDGTVWSCGNNNYGQCGYSDDIGLKSCGLKQVNTKYFNGKKRYKYLVVQELFMYY